MELWNSGMALATAGVRGWGAVYIYTWWLGGWVCVCGGECVCGRVCVWEIVCAGVFVWGGGTWGVHPAGVHDGEVDVKVVLGQLLCYDHLLSL